MAARCRDAATRSHFSRCKSVLVWQARGAGKAPTRVLAPAEAKRTNQGIMYTTGVGCVYEAPVSRVLVPCRTHA
jgi:hypothetical protein